jgi:hypothetical protein
MEQEAKALETLVKLARSADTDIRCNVAGAMYRLAMHKSIKRHFVAKVRPAVSAHCGASDDIAIGAIC